MLQPKQTKFRKAFKGRIHGLAKGGFELNFGSYALKATEPERVTARQIEAARRAITRHAAEVGLDIDHFAYIGQYPSYLVFNRVLFWLGSVYQKTIEKFALTQPLQGWIFCTLKKP